MLFKLFELANQFNVPFSGEGSVEITGVAPLVSAKKGDISFLADPRHRQFLSETKASAVIIDPRNADHCEKPCLIVDHPQLIFNQVILLFYPPKIFRPSIHHSAVIADTATLHPSVFIGPNVVIGEKVCLGENTVIEANTVIGDHTQLGSDCHVYPNVTLYHGVHIGDRVIIHSGAIIGADGFGLTQNRERHWVKIPQVGGVKIGDDVEIGASAAIDRGALTDTIIGNGVKLDNLVMIAHNAEIGDHTAMAGTSGVAGSSKVGRHCMIGAGAGVGGHLEIADGTIITGMAMIQKSITEPGIYSSGTGMQTNREWHKSVIRFRQLDEIYQRLKKLEKLCHENNDD